MELDLSPPHLSSSPEDLCPAPGTPPGTPRPPDTPLPEEVCGGGSRCNSSPRV
ncbi:GRB7 isoform 10 [Pan troglodytes]|uniref:GRB7 isoform 10 n=1 Tax=Pan troglodytes TaxID=9598 RepID=A0A2J8KGX8_PANTR|nr:GRB7 isoform 10 [Pan troglodytes]